MVEPPSFNIPIVLHTFLAIVCPSGAKQKPRLSLKNESSERLGVFSKNNSMCK